MLLLLLRVRHRKICKIDTILRKIRLSLHNFTIFAASDPFLGYSKYTPFDRYHFRHMYVKIKLGKDGYKKEMIFMSGGVNTKIYNACGIDYTHNLRLSRELSGFFNEISRKIFEPAWNTIYKMLYDNPSKRIDLLDNGFDSLFKLVKDKFDDFAANLDGTKYGNIKQYFKNRENKKQFLINLREVFRDYLSKQNEIFTLFEKEFNIEGIRHYKQIASKVINKTISMLKRQKRTDVGNCVRFSLSEIEEKLPSLRTDPIFTEFRAKFITIIENFVKNKIMIEKNIARTVEHLLEKPGLNALKSLNKTALRLEAEALRLFKPDTAASKIITAARMARQAESAALPCLVKRFEQLLLKLLRRAK